MTRASTINHKYWGTQPAYVYLNMFFPIGKKRVRELMESGEIKTIVFNGRLYTWKGACDIWLARFHYENGKTLIDEAEHMLIEFKKILEQDTNEI